MKKAAIIGIIALLVVGIAIGVYFFVKNKKQTTANAPGASPVNPSINPASPYPPVVQAPARKYPTKAELVAFAQQRNWDNGREAVAIAQTYNENTGTWQRGDWRFAITSNNPITARAFKGANETFPLSYTGRKAIHYR